MAALTSPCTGIIISSRMPVELLKIRKGLPRKVRRKARRRKRKSQVPSKLVKILIIAQVLLDFPPKRFLDHTSPNLTIGNVL
ncbi:MAG: hypothetical protein ACTSVE_14650 [Candidatus Helarchaeota archaeon]